ncbi:MAG: LacI family DNA-binding transcriptional regulator [Pseudoxanthomonas sp.]
MAGVTIKDVARVADVSVATVSRALNGHSNVVADVRERVHAVARSLKYSPNAAARSLSSRRTHTLGVVLPDLYGEFFSELVRGIDQAARLSGMHLLVSSDHGHPEEQSAALRTMVGRVDGLLVMSPYVAKPALLAEDLSLLPVVLINTQAVADGFAAISVDNYGGAVEMVEHLVKAGHRQIAFVAGPQENFDAHERLRGYRDALARRVPSSTEWIIPGDFDEASGYRAGQQMLAATALPDAVFAANDMMALGCLFAFAQAGINVPGDIAVAGFDDIPLARYVHPTLTTMRVNIADVGARAVAMLLESIAGGSTGSPGTVRLDADLIVRESSLARTRRHVRRSDSS